MQTEQPGIKACTYSCPYYVYATLTNGGSVAELLACWTQAQKGPGSNRSHDAVG